MAISLLVHILLLIVLVGHGDRIWSRTLQPGDPALPAGGSAGGGGDKRVAYITLPSIPRPQTPPRFEVPVPVPPPTQVEIAVPEPIVPPSAEPEPSDTAAVADAVQGGSENANAGPGTGLGAGQGNGGSPGAGVGTGGGGEGGTLRPPEPRSISLPFDEPPKELRGASLNVTFWVRIDGGVERYTVQPAIKDREYARKFDKVMRAFRFTPARAPDGTLVADTTTISFTLQGKSRS